MLSHTHARRDRNFHAIDPRISHRVRTGRPHPPDGRRPILRVPGHLPDDLHANQQSESESGAGGSSCVSQAPTPQFGISPRGLSGGRRATAGATNRTRIGSEVGRALSQLGTDRTEADYDEPTITIEEANDAFAKAQRVVDVVELTIAAGLGEAPSPESRTGAGGEENGREARRQRRFVK